MPIVAHTHPYVVGVDTHARTHTYAVLTADGEQYASRQFPTTTAGMLRAIAWAARITGGDADTLWAVEGTSSYGATLTRMLAEHGYLVIESPRQAARPKRGLGKSDPIDAEHIARATLAEDLDRLIWPRNGHEYRDALQILLTARTDMNDERTMKINALTAILRLSDLGVDARKALAPAQITRVAGWRTRTNEPANLRTARSEAIRLAKRIRTLDAELSRNLADIRGMILGSPAALLLQEPGIGPVTAATAYTAWSHPGRVRSEAAYAALAGTNPLPASSGNTIRHRLNRGGDRRLNKVFHMAILNRAKNDPDTRAYIQRRTQEGKTPREIRRILKRYLARRIYRILETTTNTTT